MTSEPIVSVPGPVLKDPLRLLEQGLDVRLDLGRQGLDTSPDGLEARRGLRRRRGRLPAGDVTGAGAGSCAGATTGGGTTTAGTTTGGRPAARHRRPREAWSVVRGAGSVPGPASGVVVGSGVGCVPAAAPAWATRVTGVRWNRLPKSMRPIARPRMSIETTEAMGVFSSRGRTPVTPDRSARPAPPRSPPTAPRNGCRPRTLVRTRGDPDEGEPGAADEARRSDRVPAQLDPARALAVRRAAHVEGAAHVDDADEVEGQDVAEVDAARRGRAGAVDRALEGGRDAEDLDVVRAVLRPSHRWNRST